MSVAPAPGSRTALLGVAFLEELLRDCHPRDFAIRFWDGTVFPAERGQFTRFTLVLQHPGALRSMFWSPSELTLAEAFIYNDYDIEGDIHAIFELAHFLSHRSFSIAEKLRLAALLQGLPEGEKRADGNRAVGLDGSRHSRQRDRQAVRHHYDLSNDFYRLWLDPRMQYSCAYFGTTGDDLETAQLRKLDYICRKLRLQSGERLLDVGCGWGGLVMHAAANFGVHATGITLSQSQHELAGERIRDAGLSDRCRVELRDYRELDDPAAFDKIVSVGMFEHVGEALLPEYFRRAFRLLRPGGVFLNHGIAYSPLQRPPKKSFLERYVFPDGELVPISNTLRVAESSGFEVRDLESLREHYELTLRQWLGRLEARADEARRLTDETTYRIYRLYLASSAYGFRSGRVNVYQCLLAKPDRGRSGLPLTRAEWYR